jgi:hypothetical protein
LSDNVKHVGVGEVLNARYDMVWYVGSMNGGWLLRIERERESSQDNVKVEIMMYVIRVQ